MGDVARLHDKAVRPPVRPTSPGWRTSSPPSLGDRPGTAPSAHTDRRWPGRGLVPPLHEAKAIVRITDPGMFGSMSLVRIIEKRLDPAMPSSTWPTPPPGTRRPATSSASVTTASSCTTSPSTAPRLKTSWSIPRCMIRSATPPPAGKTWSAARVEDDGGFRSQRGDGLGLPVVPW